MNRIIWMCLGATSVLLALGSDIKGSLEIQTAKTVYGSGNVDQVFGRVNLQWAFSEDSTFSSLVHLRGFPGGFGYEPMIGASYLPGEYQFINPAIINLPSPDSVLPTIQIFQAWVKYRFTDFDIRVGRLLTENSESKHFGNYLDISPGGSFMSARVGVHNAVEFTSKYNNLTTQVHLALGDVVGNRGYLRVSESIQASPQLSFFLGVKSNIFDLIHYDVTEDDANLKTTLNASTGYTLNSLARIYLEGGWSIAKNDDNKDDHIFPALVSLRLYTSDFWKQLQLPVVFEKLVVESEYLYNREKLPTLYKGIDQDFLWNLHFEKTYYKRMFLEASLFAAPTPKYLWNTGLGLRFSSQIN